MKYFTLLKGDRVLLRERKLVSAEEMAHLVSAEEIVQLSYKEAEEYKKENEKIAEALFEAEKERGFNEGIKQWNEQLAYLENELRSVRSDLQKAIVPLAMTAIRKILGRQIEEVSDTIVDIIANSIKTVAHHRHITLYVQRADLEIVEQSRPRLKALFENLESLTIATRDDIKPGGCIIETERGIVNVSLDLQLNALENAFKSIVDQNQTF